MKKLFKLGLILAGAAALSFTMASATSDSGKEAPKTMKCESGKCNGDMKKDMKCNGGKDMNKTADKKPAPKKGSCGTGKCG